MTLGQLATLLGGTLHGPADLLLERPGAFDQGGPGEVVVAFDEAAARVAEGTAAAAVVVPEGVAVDRPHITVAAPKQALVAVAAAFAPPSAPAEGVHPTAVIDPSVVLPDNLTVGPYAVIGAGCVVAAGCRIGAHGILGEGCRLGAGVILHPRVTLYPEVELGAGTIVHSGAVLGADGYGYQFVDGRHEKIPQVGRVVIGEGVEIGANTCIDRAMVGTTAIGSGTKIDNLVQIGHNVRIGRHVLLVSQVGVAGSCRLGDYVVLGGQAGMADHVTVGDGAMVAAQAGLMDEVPPGAKVGGSPAQPQRDWFRQITLERRLPELLRRLRAVEQRLGEEPVDGA